MSDIKRWYEEVAQVTKIHETISEEFVVYKGFKLSKLLDGSYIIKDTRFSNMYSNVSDNVMKQFEKLGIIKGIDTIGFERDKRRVESYKRRTGRLYDKRIKFKKELPKNKRLNEKRIRNINKRISDFVDLIFYYDTRVKQYNSKYNDKHEQP